METSLWVKRKID